MLIPGTQMHIVTFLFVSIEIVIFFYLLIYRLARPDDKTAFLNIVLIFLLITYNITGGLLPDGNMPGSFFIQVALAYATGFITPCYFPYYVYRAFALEKMKFHAYKGIYLFLIIPYLIFVLIFALTNKLDVAKDLLILPVAYALWVIVSMIKAIRYKYKNDFSSRQSKEEMSVLLLSLTPWVMLPVIDFFDMGQPVEASITNFGFLSLFALQMKRHIKEMRKEHERLITSEQQLLNWNTTLQKEVEKRTRELEIINEQRTNTFINLAHETKTPLTLINNYLGEYISKNLPSEELGIVKRNIEKLSNDIVNLFDLEKFNKGFAFYNHNLICNFSEVLKDSIILFRQYFSGNNINIKEKIKDRILIKADPLSINRVINNLIENAIKFSEGDIILMEIELNIQGNIISFSVKDFGIGIPVEMQSKVFEPYYQLTNRKRNANGMGLGLPIVKKVIDDLGGEIQIISNPKTKPGTEILISLKQYQEIGENSVESNFSIKPLNLNKENKLVEKLLLEKGKQNILVVEDNITMINYLIKKLSDKYNVIPAFNGQDAIKKMKELSGIPDLIITDIMMDNMDGHAFAKILSKSSSFSHIPFIFLTAKSTLNDKLQGLKIGAIDYVPKPFSISELILKIDSILLNSKKQKKAIWNKAFDSLNLNNSHSKINSSTAFEHNCNLYQLTSREKDIAKLICQGHKYRDIGNTLFIAERTVTKHAQNIFEKLQISNKIELINKLEFS